MKIREYAKSVGFEIVGNLTRRPEWEYTTDDFTGKKKHSGFRHYSDEGGNEYISGEGGVCIVTADDDLI